MTKQEMSRLEKSVVCMKDKGACVHMREERDGGDRGGKAIESTTT